MTTKLTARKLTQLSFAKAAAKKGGPALTAAAQVAQQRRRTVVAASASSASRRSMATITAATPAPGRDGQGMTPAEQAGIAAIGIHNPKVIFKNLSYPDLRAHEIKNKEGVVTNHGGANTAEGKGCYAVDTGIFTGRSPKDKFIVKRPGAESDANLWWGSVNQPMKSEVFDELMDEALAHYNSQDQCYVFDGFVGASKSSQRKVRFVHDLAWQQHFVTNMFIRPDEVEAHNVDHEPDFTVINACALKNEKWKDHGLNSDVCVAIDVEKKLAVIMGTWYGGENKKLIFSLMNYWLPMEGTLPMHCSASVDGEGKNAALFFGLSGTGKTTLSADPNRQLIGDDEHGWHGKDGIFNFEGGCYAKTINLKEENEPEIWNAIKDGALLENVMVDEATGAVDYDDTSKTQNGRVSYPIFHIDNHEPSSQGGHPENVIFLTADAFGVLPPVSKLTTEQALYHFITGYTAKVAGTERGVTEPEATFSACFGAAFLTMHPTKYADLLRQRLDEHGSQAYLVNTGWVGGAYGVGKRMAIGATRSCITSILDGGIGKLGDDAFTADPVFGFQIPKAVPGVDADVPLDPRSAWADKDAYDAQRLKLAGMFQENFKKYTGPGVVDYSAFGPRISK